MTPPLWPPPAVYTLAQQRHDSSLRFPLTCSSCCSYGDWCWVPKTPKCSNHLTAAFSVLENLNQMTDLATALGKDTDAAIWAAYAHTLKTAFHRTSALTV